MEWKGDQVSRALKAAALEATWKGAESILTAAIDLTPIESGTLRRSGTVTIGELPNMMAVYEAAEAGIKAHKKGDMPSQLSSNQGLGLNLGGGHRYVAPNMDKKTTVYISFNTPYARRQHEDLTLQHTDGQAKYLETAYKQQLPKVYKYINLSLKKALRSALK